MDYLIYKSLFPYIDLIKYPTHYNFIPTNCFGSFVSIKRTRIEQFPYDVHGCIGNYKGTFDSKFKKDIYKIILNVGYDALYNDERKNNFPEIYLDSNAQFEIELMLNPVLEINKLTGQIKGTNEYFNNENYGLIYKNKNSSATYLPNVFEDISWNEIKKNIKIKSRQSKQQNISNEKYYAYKTKKIKKKLINIIPSIRNTIFNSFLNFNEKYFTKNVPYALEFKNVIYDSNQLVRNNGTLYDLYILGFKNKDILNKEIKKYYDLFLKDKNSMRQASAFLIRCLNDKNKINKICKYLLSNINNLESNFERGEVLIGLIDKCNNDLKVLKVIKKMNNEFESEDTDISIFRCNWEAKVIYIYKKKTNSNMFDNYAKKIMKKIELIANMYNINTETNELVVAFESLMSLKYVLGSRLSLKANNIIFKCFYILMYRFKDNLIYFKDMKIARLDMTGHFIQGLLTTIKNN